MVTNRRHNGMWIKTWQAILALILMLGTALGGTLYDKYRINSVMFTVNKQLVPKVINLEKRAEVNEEKHNGESRLYNEKLKTINEKLDDASKERDAIIKAIKKLSENTLIIYDDSKKNNG